MRYKSKRAKATDIPLKVRAAVYDRDGGKCIFCGRWQVHPDMAHYIGRAHGGLGIEQNLVTACRKCHEEMDNGKHRQIYREVARKHLVSVYAGWDESMLVYRKGEI